MSELVEAYNDFHIPSYHCLGNHDCDRTPYAEVLDYYRLCEKGYYSFDCKGYRIIVLDTNYYKEGEDFVHYEMRSQFDHPRQLDSLPPEELDWLFRTVEESPFDPYDPNQVDLRGNVNYKEPTEPTEATEGAE